MNTAGVRGQQTRRINPPTYVGGSPRRRLDKQNRERMHNANFLHIN
ncbi:MAG: hypothetical protein ACRCUY_11960 [Thermoguttaceae bacterium]